MLMVVESNGVCMKDPIENTSKRSNGDINEIESKLFNFYISLFELCIVY